jgi:hypothetical protein
MTAQGSPQWLINQGTDTVGHVSRTKALVVHGEQRLDNSRVYIHCRCRPPCLKDRHNPVHAQGVKVRVERFLSRLASDPLEKSDDPRLALALLALFLRFETEKTTRPVIARKIQCVVVGEVVLRLRDRDD